jgi:DNA-binding CsgD family transcriptional regulator
LDADEVLLAAISTNLDALSYLSSIAFCRLLASELDQAERLAAAVVSTATAQGVTAAIPFALAVHATIDYRRGAWAGAIARGHQALELATATGRLPDLAAAHSVLATVAAAQGRAEDCREHASACERYSSATGSHVFEARVYGALGLLELGLGRPTIAVAQLLRAEKLCRRLELLELSYWQWAAELVEARVELGQPDEALPTVELLEWHADRTGRPIAIGLAARCRGLISSTRSNDHHFSRAINAHRVAGQPFELARTHLCFGQRLRRSKSRALARDQLEAALTLFVELDATLWAELARTELAGCGVKLAPAQGRVTDTLTSRELQIAAAVSAGASNPEVAAQLFISRKTVEYHLGSIFRKLRVRSRDQLAALLDTGTLQTSRVECS